MKKTEERLEDVLPEGGDLLNGFLAMYAGCRAESTIFPNGSFFCGKAECEWIWPEGWEILRDRGLIEYTIKNVICFDGDIMKEVHLRTTERGDKLRDEYWES